MQSDEKLKKLLTQHAEENISADFTIRVMRQIEAASVASQKVSLLRQRPIQIVMIAFAAVCFALLIMSIFLKPVALPSYLDIKSLMPYCLQITYFLLIFWTILLANQLWSKRMMPVTA